MSSLRLSAAPVALLLVGAISTPVVAAPEAGEAGERVVDDRITVIGEYRRPETSSATKTPTLLIDIPQSLSVISQEQIEDQALADIGDILRYTPGASVGQGEGHRDQITIRGQNTTADFFIDGLRDDVQYFRPLYNLERVEILRGSNALIFGRGGGGGVVNRVTKTPDLDDAFSAIRTGVDTFGATNVSTDVNAPVGDNAAFRLNAFYEHLDNHRDEFEGDRFAINPTFKALLGADTTLVLSYEYVYDDRVVDRGVPSVNGRPLEGFDETFFGAPDANATDLTASIARARLDHEIAEGWSANLTLQYADYDKLYQNLFPVGFDDIADEVTLDGYRDATDRRNFIAQTNLIGEFATGPIRHTLLAGVEYADQQTENSRRDVFFAASSDDQIRFAFTDPLQIPTFAFPTINRDRESEVSVFSAYVQDQIDVGPYVKIVGGVRYDRFEIDVLDAIEAANGAGDGNDGNLGSVDEEISPRVGLILKPLERLSVYGSFSKSFLPRSGDQFLTLSLSSEALEPEEFENIEAGVKWDVTDALAITAAVFRLDRESGVAVDPTNPDNTILVGSRTEGVELQVVGEVTARWSLSGGYSYLDARQRGNISGGAIDNNTLSNAPEHLFSLWNRFEASETLGLGVGVVHQSSQFASLSNAVELPGFTRLDAALFYALTDRIDVQLNVENLTGAEYFPSAHNDNNISTGEPANARFTVSGRF